MKNLFKSAIWGLRGEKGLRVNWIESEGAQSSALIKPTKSRPWVEHTPYSFGPESLDWDGNARTPVLSELNTDLSCIYPTPSILNWIWHATTPMVQSTSSAARTLKWSYGGSVLNWVRLSIICTLMSASAMPWSFSPRKVLARIALLPPWPSRIFRRLRIQMHETFLWLINPSFEPPRSEFKTFKIDSRNTSQDTWFLQPGSCWTRYINGFW